MNKSKSFFKELNSSPGAVENESKLWDYFSTTTAYLWVEDFTETIAAIQTHLEAHQTEAEPYEGYLNNAIAEMVQHEEKSPRAVFGNPTAQTLTLSPARNDFEKRSLIARAYQGLLKAIVEEVINGVMHFEKSAYWMIEGVKRFLLLQFEIQKSDQKILVYVAGMEHEPVKPNDTQGLIAQYTLLFEMTQSVLVASSSKKFLEKAVASIHKHYDSARTMVALVDLDRRSLTRVFINDRELSKAEIMTEVSEHDFWDGLSGWAIRTRETVYSPKNIPDYRETESSMANRTANDRGAVVVVPIISQQKIYGTLTIINKSNRGAIKNFDIQVAGTVANQLAIGLQHFRLLERTRLMAHSDLVTGLLNREHFMQLAEVEYEQSMLKNESLGVIMLDIDFFKGINDQHGLEVGDDVLHEVGQRIRTHLINKKGLFSRYDGDEFVILMPIKNGRTLWNTAEELRIAISNAPVVSSPIVLKINTSAGIAFVEGNHQKLNLRDLLNVASQALAQAKQNGRGRVWPPR